MLITFLCPLNKVSLVIRICVSVSTEDGPFYKMPKPSTFPDPPSKPVITGVTDTSVHLSWEVEPDLAKSRILNYIVDYFSFETPEVGLDFVSESRPNIPHTQETRLSALRPPIHYQIQSYDPISC